MDRVPFRVSTQECVALQSEVRSVQGNKFEKRTIGIWLLAGLWAVLPLLGWWSYGPKPFGLACSVDWIWTGMVPALGATMAVMISLGFILAWGPYVSVSLWSMFQPADQRGSLPPVISLLPCLFSKTSTVYNPFIYCIFQRSFAKHLCCCGGGGGPATEIKQNYVPCDGSSPMVLEDNLSGR
ncbi:unnamed protein product [Lota lota]